MKLSRKLIPSIGVVLVGISIFFWIILLFDSGKMLGVKHCHVSDSGASEASLKMLLEMNPFSSLLIGWGLMVVAMMLPKLTFPISDIYSRSFKRRRFMSALCFVFGYIAVWMVVGVIMCAIILAMHLILPNSFLPAIGLGVITIVWQFSPIKQHCLNKGHEHRILSAFGLKGYQDAMLFGFVHGFWCVGAGWALMLLPMLLPAGHDLAMIIVTFIMISEHLEHPRFPRWRLTFRGKLFRYFTAQTRIKVKNVFNLN